MQNMRRRITLSLEIGMGKFSRKALLLAPIMFILAGCASVEQPRQEPGVEDLSPGDKTVIEAPTRQPADQGGVSEKNI